MHIARAHLRSVTPYSQSKNIDKEEHPALPKETADAYEKRNWRNRIHVNSSGNIVIPQTAFTNCVMQAARRLQLQIPGKGKTQYTKYFEGGITVARDLETSTKAKDVVGERLFVPSDGRPGGGSRVWRTFPKIEKWEGVVTYAIFDDIIVQDVFAKVLQSAGMLVGIGRFRPENRGYYGRFAVEKLDWIENGDAAFAAAMDQAAE
jgi:hypothetical protein